VLSSISVSEQLKKRKRVSIQDTFISTHLVGKFFVAIWFLITGEPGKL